MARSGGRTEQGCQEPGQPSAEQTEVVAHGGEDDVRGFALGAEEEVAAEVAVAPHVTDDGLDGVAAAPLATDGRRDAALLAGEDDADVVSVVATVAAIDIGALDFDAGDALGLGDLLGEGVTVIGIARERAGAEDELPARGLGVGRGE